MKLYKLKTSDKTFDIYAFDIDGALQKAEIVLDDRIDITAYDSNNVDGFTSKIMDSVSIQEISKD